MITNGTFGDTFGRLGNQLFQVGLLFAIKERHGYDFFLPREGAVLWDCFELDVPATGPECDHRFRERYGSCNFDAQVFEEPDGTMFEGYFQSYRYLEDCKASLLRFLRFRVEHRAYSEAMLFAYRRRYRRPVVGLHVRRQDYVGPVPKMLGAIWRATATTTGRSRQSGDDVTYLVFSDDLEWCRRSLGLERAEYIDADTATTLCLMTSCDAMVIANSSFSWWGAYLNPQAEVYAPSRWFGPAMPPPNDRQDDIVPPAWRLIPVGWAD